MFNKISNLFDQCSTLFGNISLKSRTVIRSYKRYLWIEISICDSVPSLNRIEKERDGSRQKKAEEWRIIIFTRARRTYVTLSYCKTRPRFSRCSQRLSMYCVVPPFHIVLWQQSATHLITSIERNVEDLVPLDHQDGGISSKQKVVVTRNKDNARLYNFKPPFRGDGGNVCRLIISLPIGEKKKKKKNLKSFSLRGLFDVDSNVQKDCLRRFQILYCSLKQQSLMTMLYLYNDSLIFSTQRCVRDYYILRVRCFFIIRIDHFLIYRDSQLVEK